MECELVHIRVSQPLRTGSVLISHVNISCPHPSSSNVATIVGVHLAVYLQWSSCSTDPVVPRWSSGVAFMYLLAGSGIVVFGVSYADGQLPCLLKNVSSQLFNHSIRYCTRWTCLTLGSRCTRFTRQCLNSWVRRCLATDSPCCFSVGEDCDSTENKEELDPEHYCRLSELRQNLQLIFLYL